MEDVAIAWIGGYITGLISCSVIYIFLRLINSKNKNKEE